jgi:hypothetical protein
LGLSAADADYWVCTIPLPVLSGIQKDLSQPVQSAISAASYDAQAKSACSPGAGSGNKTTRSTAADRGLIRSLDKSGERALELGRVLRVNDELNVHKISKNIFVIYSATYSHFFGNPVRISMSPCHNLPRSEAPLSRNAAARSFLICCTNTSRAHRTEAFFNFLRNLWHHNDNEANRVKQKKESSAAASRV